MAILARFVVDCGVGGSPTSWVGPRHTTREYVALTKLQADAFVTLDADLARRVEQIVPTATIDALRAT